MIAAITPTSANHTFGIWAQLLAEKEEPAPAGEEDDSLEDVGRHEREYMRNRLRDKLNREPSEQETDEYIRQQTEGY
ncbi:MAG: hypothetical protein WKF30_07625 [Pyrinomonadaceae bacterium]